MAKNYPASGLRAGCGFFFAGRIASPTRTRRNQKDVSRRAAEVFNAGTWIRSKGVSRKDAKFAKETLEFSV